MKKAAVFVIAFLMAFTAATPAVFAESKTEYLSKIVNAKALGDTELYDLAVTAAARSGVLNSRQKREYQKDLEAYVAENKANLSPYDIWRLCAASNAAGIGDIVGGYDLLTRIYDLDFASGKSESAAYDDAAAIYSLMALDMSGKALPESYVDGEGTDRQVTVTRLKLVDILVQKAQNSDGSFGVQSYLTPDLRLTAMGAVALARYAETDALAQDAVEAALSMLSKNQKSDGGFVSADGADTAATACVMLAVCTAGVNPLKTDDGGFVKEAGMVDFLDSMRTENGDYKPQRNSESGDFEATIAAATAFNALERLEKGRENFYDMRQKDDSAAFLAVGVSVGVLLLLLAFFLWRYRKRTVKK